MKTKLDKHNTPSKVDAGKREAEICNQYVQIPFDGHEVAYPYLFSRFLTASLLLPPPHSSFTCALSRSGSSSEKKARYGMVSMDFQHSIRAWENRLATNTTISKKNLWGNDRSDASPNPFASLLLVSQAQRNLCLEPPQPFIITIHCQKHPKTLSEWTYRLGASKCKMKEVLQAVCPHYDVTHMQALLSSYLLWLVLLCGYLLVSFSFDGPALFDRRVSGPYLLSLSFLIVSSPLFTIQQHCTTCILLMHQQVDLFSGT